MEHYIDKDTLVAEINRRIAFFSDINNKQVIDSNLDCAIAFAGLRDFLDTLDVKEVDLENEIKKIQRKYKTIEEYEGYPCTMYANDIEWIAKNFFELGLSVSNKARK